MDKNKICREVPAEEDEKDKLFPKDCPECGTPLIESVVPGIYP